MSKVVYRKNGGRRRAGYPLLVLCAVLLFGFSLVNIVWPKRTQLELENRKAAQLPAFSVSALLDGSWQSGFARWMQDQFSLRDAAVNTQRTADEVLFRKAEEGGILLGKDRWMFTKLFTVDDATRKQLAKNVQAVSEFAANHPGKVTFLLAERLAEHLAEIDHAHLRARHARDVEGRHSLRGPDEIRRRQQKARQF